MTLVQVRRMAELNVTTRSNSLAGLLFGAGAIVLWSLSASVVRVGSEALGPWQFLAGSCLLGGCYQMVFRRTCDGHFRNAVGLPARLWLLTIFGFVLYGIAYPLAVALAASREQACGVNLVNYLWPTLTVVLGVLLVPGTNFSGLLAVALACVLAGTVLANREGAGALFTTERMSFAALLPYLLALLAAILWSGYSALLARWRDWAGRYNTSGMGLLGVGLIAGVVCLFHDADAGPIGFRGIGVLVLAGLGPWGNGYLLWELALSRANVKTLGLMAAVTPILSTLWLCLFLWFVPGWDLIAGAVLVTAAVFLSLRSQ